MSENIKVNLQQAFQRGTKRLQEFNESWTQFSWPWNTTAKTKFTELLHGMNLSLNEFDSCYKQWQKLIRELDDKNKAKTEEQTLIEWKDKPEYDDLIFDLDFAVIQIEVYMKSKVDDNFQGEAPTNNTLPSMEKQGMSLSKEYLCHDTAKSEAVITRKLGRVKANMEKIRVTDAKVPKPSLVETTDDIMDIQSENSTTQIVSIEPPRASTRKKTLKRTKALEKSNAALLVKKADCKKIAPDQAVIENEERHVPTVMADFQRQNKYDRPPSPNFQHIDEQTSEKPVKPNFMDKLDPFVSREIFEHSTIIPEKSSSSGKLKKGKPKTVNQSGPFDPRVVFDQSVVGDKNFPKIECGREWLPAQGEKHVEQFDKYLGHIGSAYDSQRRVEISKTPSSKETECWKDKPPECFWEAKTLTPSTKL